MSAPVTAIVAYDCLFAEHMPTLFPARDMKVAFAAMSDEDGTRSAILNATLEGAYLIIAARGLGLDCAPMAGFDRAEVDEAFLGGTSWKSLFLLNLGNGDATKLFARNPRLPFATSAWIRRTTTPISARA